MRDEGVVWLLPLDGAIAEHLGVGGGHEGLVHGDVDVVGPLGVEGDLDLARLGRIGSELGLQGQR